MPLIIKGGKEPIIVSKEEISKKINEIQSAMTQEEEVLATLPPEVAERRREIIAAKRHREFMEKIQKQESAAMRKLQDAEISTTNEIIVEISSEAINVVLDDVVKVSTFTDVTSSTPNFNSMTKKELDEWAEENLGITLDRRKKKEDLIQIIKNSL